MITLYRKNQRKIAMGLLSFHKNLHEHRHLLKEIDTYEEDEKYQLYCFYCDGSSKNVQGLIGISLDDAQELVLHDICLNPSYRGERLGYEMMDQLQQAHPDHRIIGTRATAAFLDKWKRSRGIE
ncbi:protein RibT [Enterococcus florum]|uniref:Protein RibT n=1 Tax=Enterococcus florum TaxID=2480627 RepID=A0A4P5P984_9ENTE|nr:GNAT family N-acetyltransferase [Enterococcus florum]GCF92781.1 protein RibT [Enterococcus florum]